ncbi:hypothetical protein [Tsukamurella soli]|uniref:hypothetical protein n=1 Tax=Tsukamurella soli TaxID=644556 RepID=UPI0036067ABA
MPPPPGLGPQVASPGHTALAAGRVWWWGSMVPIMPTAATMPMTAAAPRTWAGDGAGIRAARSRVSPVVRILPTMTITSQNPRNTAGTGR